MDRPDFPPKPLAEVLSPEDYAYVKEKLAEGGQTSAAEVFLCEPSLADRQRLAVLVDKQHIEAESLAIKWLYKRRDRSPAFADSWVERAPASHLDPLGTAAVEYIIDYNRQVEDYEGFLEAKKRRAAPPPPTPGTSADGSSNSS